MITAKDRLVILAQLDRQLANFMLARDKEIDLILTPEVKAQIKKVKEEYQFFIDGIQEEYSVNEAKIKDEVLQSGETVKGVYQAIYVKGRISWDTEMLGGYALAHPEIESLRRVGKASVRIKK